jgi:hypothetical protein
MTIDRNFLGIRIEGQITDGRAEQLPQERFEPLVRALLDDPLIAAFGWRQYTPYFNDGDTCIFSARGLWVRTAEVQPGEAEEQDTTRAKQLAALNEARRLGALNDRQYQAARERIEEDEDEDDGGSSNLDINYNIHPVLGGIDGYGSAARYVGKHEDTWRKAEALSDAIENSQFDGVLLHLFGDHAEVTIRRDGITVKSYQHD